MPVTYLNREILSPEEFIAERDSGWFNPNSTYEGYLLMIEEQMQMREKARAEAAAQGFELGFPEGDMSPEMEAILDEVWADLRELKRREAAAEPAFAAQAA